MVIRTRLRAILFPLALYAVSGVVSSYFIWHADNGERGAKARAAYKTKIKELRGELAELESERSLIETRVRMFQSDAVDADLLDEEARAQLGRANRNEIVVVFPTDH